MQRKYVIVTDSSATLLPDGHYHYHYPTSVMCANGNIKKIVVENCY